MTLDYIITIDYRGHGPFTRLGWGGRVGGDDVQHMIGCLERVVMTSSTFTLGLSAFLGLLLRLRFKFYSHKRSTRVCLSLFSPSTALHVLARPSQLPRSRLLPLGSNTCGRLWSEWDRAGSSWVEASCCLFRACVWNGPPLEGKTDRQTE